MGVKQCESIVRSVFAIDLTTQHGYKKMDNTMRFSIKFCISECEKYVTTSNSDGGEMGETWMIDHQKSFPPSISLSNGAIIEWIAPSKSA